MKCSFCGAESGNFQLCSACYHKKVSGDIIKCEKCGKIHIKDVFCSCETPSEIQIQAPYLYSKKKFLLSTTEKDYFNVIKKCVPENFNVYPQVNFAAFIVKNDDSPYRSELFRNADFLITNEKSEPLIAIEINDPTHIQSDRKFRDEKIKNICAEAGIILIRFWTSYGINPEYISRKINSAINDSPISQKHCFVSSVGFEPIDDIDLEFEEEPQVIPPEETMQTKNLQKKQGCYIATCLYGSYDAPKVMILRKYRDEVLSKSAFGRNFIKFYYAVSPTIVKIFGNSSVFKRICIKPLDKIVSYLEKKGFGN